MAKEFIITDEVSRELDSIDWDALRAQHITRADVESNPQAACELAEGRATTVLVSYVIPGIPETQEAQLVSRRTIDIETGERVLDPRVIVRKIDKSYVLSPDNLVIAGLYDEDGRNYRLNPSDPHEKAIIDAIMPRTEKGRDGEERTYTCSICPIPLQIRYRSGRETTSYLGWDPTSNRPVYRNADNLRAMLLTEDGHSRLTRPLFGKGIEVSDEMARAMAEGQVVGALGEVNGKKFATALSFNIARGQITEDHSKAGESVRQAAYEYLRRTRGVEEAGPSEKAGIRSDRSRAAAQKVPSAAQERKRGPRRTI